MSLWGLGFKMHQTSQKQCWNGHEGSYWGDENVAKLVCHDHGTTWST